MHCNPSERSSCRTSERAAGAPALACVLLLALLPATAWGQLVINEIDYDQPSTDTAEFVEIKNTSGGAIDLDPYSLELVNGSNGSVYDTIDLPAVMLAAGDYYVVCGDAANVENCDLDVSPNSNLIQNGAPDAVALMLGAVIIDTVSYEGDLAGFVEGSGSGLTDDPGVDLAGLSRFPDGVDTNQNNVDLSLRCITPGEANVADSSSCDSLGGTPNLVLNEVDYDQPSTDDAEFIEITNTGTAPADLDPYEIQLVNGSGGAVYDTIDLPAVSLAPGEYYVVCGDAANVENCDLDVSPDTNLIQNGAPDAVALVLAGAVVDTLSYEGDVVAPYTEGTGAGTDDPSVDFLGLSRFPDGADTDDNSVDWSPRCTTPGLANTAEDTGCGPAVAPMLVINEIDYDQPSTDGAEFVEIKNVGAAAASLAGVSLELINGSNGSQYGSFALPSVSLGAGDYFVVCGDAANVPGCDLDVSPDTNLIQNGAPDAVTLSFGSQLLDAVSYEGSVPGAVEGSGDGLSDSSSIDFLGISRFPDGADTDQNNVDLSRRCITPGQPNGEASSGCTQPVLSAIVINEIDYDQPGGDAGEFVELANVSGSAVDLDPYTLQLVNGSGGAVYNSFDLPAVSLAAGDYYVICANAATVVNCDLDVSPNTNLLQNGSPDAVALILGGSVADALSYEGDVPGFVEGSGAGLTDPSSDDFLGLSRFPDGADTDQNNVDFSPRCITPGAANTFVDTDCSATGPTFEIFEIQGSGPASPFAGQAVTTAENVVTAVGPQGFFIQTPEARSDGDIETSDGIFVFTSSAPAVAVGDLVTVNGQVVEFFDLTEFSNGPLVTVLSSGSALPAPVVLDATTPSPNQPQSANELERFEGMLVSFDGVATAATDQFGDTAVVAGPSRAFREPGIEFPGLAGLPVWDGNPEIFEVNPDGIGGLDEIFFAGQTLSAAGPLSFSFGDYQVWPTSLTIGPVPLLPRPVRARAAGEFTIASLNMLRIFDDQDDPAINEPVNTPAEFAALLAKFSLYIREVLRSPDILAVQEVENLNVLVQLALQLAADDPALSYSAHLIEGNDVGGIDVGYLTRDDTIQVDSVSQFGAALTLSFDGSLLYDRPPLVLEGEYIGGGLPFPLTVINVHQRSLSGIEGSSATRVKTKRLEQAQELAGLVQDLQTMDPSIRLVVTGDFNAFQFTDGYVDVMGIVSGDLDPLGAEFPGMDVVDPNLANQVFGLSAEERYSFVFGGSAQVLDHALTSASIGPFVNGFEYGRGNADSPNFFMADPATALRASDHDGLVLFLMREEIPDEDGDGVPDDADLCPGTTIPEDVPQKWLLPWRWALVDGDTTFDTEDFFGHLPPFGFTVEDTGGCSCEQILDALPGQRIGERFFGCRSLTMKYWVRYVVD